MAASPFTVGVPQSLFAVGRTGGPSLSGFDVAPDGRLLMTRSAPPVDGDEPRAVLPKLDGCARQIISGLE